MEYALIELIREEPALWDIADANYTKNTLKREFFKKVAATLRELFPHVQDVRLFEICNVILIGYVGLTCGKCRKVIARRSFAVTAFRIFVSCLVIAGLTSPRIS